MAIDVVGLVACALALRYELKRRRRQMTRLTREETLATLRVELASGKRLKMGELRGVSRPVLVAGTRAQVAAALAAAAPYREQLEERAVFVVPLPIYSESGEREPGLGLVDRPDEADLRWKGAPLDVGAWTKWFNAQLDTSKATATEGLYLSLRMDGRVRASGQGPPPWHIIAAQLAPVSGMWKGFLDGMDGRVG